MNTLAEQIGQLFVLGFSDTTPSASFLSFLSEAQPGGVILFENNCPTYEATQETIQLIKSKYNRGTVPLIAVDQEGGRVSRLRGAPAEIKSASYYAEHKNVERFIEDYSRSAVCLESLGFNLNFAPVADLSLASAGGCLEGRSFGSDPEVVAKFVEASVRVASESRLLSCLKHFPGLGTAQLDPHHKLPTADYDKMVWEQREMIPFAAGIAAGADLVMTTHLLLPAIDDKIVTASSQIATDMVRDILCFEGPLITDDLCMKGADSIGDIGERAVTAFNAGHDILLFGQDFDRALEAFEHFLNAIDRGEIDQRRLKTALSRISGAKFKLATSVIP